MATITVKALKELLNHPDIKDSDLVIMSSDPEGNNYHLWMAGRLIFVTATQKIFIHAN